MKKTAVVDIKINGLNTISQLEQELADVNSQLKNIDINSQEFETLSNRAAQATQKLETINTQLKGVSAQEKTDAIKKLGEGLVGAFQVGAGASLIFGEKTSEELNKVIAKVAGVYSAVDGLDKISKAFSSENISRLKSLGAQFKIVGNGAKIMGVTMKTALISTGIGALVVALGIVAANWDKITAAIKRNKAEKARANEAKQLETEIKYQEDKIKLLEEEAAAQKKINDLNGESENNAQVDIDLAKEKIALIEKENELLENQRLDLVTRQESEKKNLELQERMAKLYAERGVDLSDNVKKAQEALVITQNDLEINKKGIAVNQIKIKQLEEEQRLLQNDKNSKPYKERLKLADQIVDSLKKQNELSEIQGLQSEKIYQRNKKIIDLEKGAISLKLAIGKITSEEYNKQLTALEHQDDLLDAANKKRKEILATQLKELETSINYQKDLAATISYMDMLKNTVDRSNAAINESNDAINAQVDTTNLLLEQYKRFVEIQESGTNNDKKREKVNSILLSQYDEINTLLAQNKDYLVENYETSKNIIVDISNGLKLDEEKLKIAADKISIERMFYDTIEKELNQQRLQLTVNLSTYETEVKRLKNLDDIESKKLAGLKTEIELLEKANLSEKNDEKRLENTQKLNGLYNEYNQTANNVLSINNDILSSEENIRETKKQISITDQTILNNATQLKQTEIEITGELVKQSRVSKELKDWAEKYREEIQATLDVMNAGFEFVGALFERKVASAQKDIDDSRERVKDLQEEQDAYDKRKEKSTKKLIDLQEKLKDADGERYDELLAMIAEEQAANEETAVNNKEAIDDETNKQLEAQYKIDMANYNSAIFDKTQAAINSAIFTLLAVVKALPNVFLSTAVGIAGGIATAAIIAKPLPPKPKEPEYLEDGGLLQGKSHKEGGIAVEAEGGEFIINKRSTSKYLPLLEAINESGRRKFADGGVVAPTINTANSGDMIDYARLAGEISKLNIMVSVVDINKGQQRVKVVQNSASL